MDIIECINGKYFNPRSREGSDLPLNEQCNKQSYFNPRSREGSDPSPQGMFTTNYFISIHAPAKGATVFNGAEGKSEEISIHAPAKGATGITLKAYPLCWYFNPRSREGSDNYHAKLRYNISIISIHAPAKGATVIRIYTVNLVNISIHAPAKGATSGVCHMAFI